jgi:hypothetical protein
MPGQRKKGVTVISLPLEAPLLAGLEAYAKAHNTTRLQVIRDAISAKIGTSNVEPFPETPAHWVRLVGCVAAGSQISMDAQDESLRVDRPWPEDHYALRVFGKSMAPKIKDRDLILVRRLAEGEFPKKGQIVVYSDAHGLSLKVLAYRPARDDEQGNAFGKVPMLKSLNPAYPEVETMDGGRIEAVYVETI